MNLLRLVRVLLALPGRAVIWWLNSISYPQLTRPLRASVHALVWVLTLMAFSMATVSTTIPPAPEPVVRTAPTYVPRPVPTFEVDPVPERGDPGPAGPVNLPDVDVDEGLVEHENDGESWFCRRRRWC